MLMELWLLFLSPEAWTICSHHSENAAFVALKTNIRSYFWLESVYCVSAAYGIEQNQYITGEVFS